MRSGVGAACPFTRRDFFLEEVFLVPPAFRVVVPVVLVGAEAALLAALTWLLLDAVPCAAAAGILQLPTAIAARMHAVSVCLKSKVRITGYVRPRPSFTCRPPALRPAETPSRSGRCSYGGAL